MPEILKIEHKTVEVPYEEMLEKAEKLKSIFSIAIIRNNKSFNQNFNRCKNE